MATDRHDARRNKCQDCCADYNEALRYGMLRKKSLSADESSVLKTHLKRCLNTCDLYAYGLAAMLGGSIYVLTGAVMHTRTGPAVFLAYLIAGLVALLNSLVYSELACRIPKAGSSYSYAYILLGEFFAFLTGWSILLEYILGTATVARGWSSMLDGLTGRAISTWIITHIGRLGNPGDILAEYPDLIGAVLIVLIAGITCCGVRGGARVTGVFICVNVIVLLGASIFMYLFANPSNLTIPVPSNVTDTDPYSPHPQLIPFGLSGLIGGVAICFNAFIGFDAISTCAEEAKSPSKSLPRANFLAVFTVTLVTITASLALSMYYPWYLVSADTPFLSVLSDNTMGGSKEVRLGMFYFVGCGCLIGLTSSLLSNLVAGPRVSYAMAQDGLLPTCCGQVCHPFQTPVVSTAVVALITAILDILFSIVSLADFLSLGTLIAYSIASIGLLRLRYATQPEDYPARTTREQREADVDTTDEGDALDDRSSQEILTGNFDNLRTDKPGYLKGSWTNCMSSKTIQTLNSGPPGTAVSVLISVYLLINIILIIILKVGEPEGLWPVWRLVLIAILLAIMITCIILMSAYKQHRSPRRDLFRLPFVPLFPCATLTVNLFLISELSWITWVRYSIWVALGLIIYFAYGVCHSTEAAREGHSWARGEIPESEETDNEGTVNSKTYNSP